MANKYGVNATKRDVSVPSVKIAPGEVGGAVQFAYDEYSLTADLAANDVIKLMKLPAGARVLDVVVNSADLDSGATGEIKVGWAANGVDAADDDGFITALDIHTAAAAKAMSSLQAAAGYFKKFTVETQVEIVISGDTNATSGKIMLGVQYVVV